MTNSRGKTRNQGRTGNLVGKRASVEVEQNTRVVGLVKLSSLDTRRRERTTTGDLQVEALGIVLSTIGLSCTVKGDDFVTENIVAGFQLGRDLKSPGEAVCDENIGSPSTALQGHVEKTALADLEELERVFVNGLAVARAFSEIVNDWTFVTLHAPISIRLERVQYQEGKPQARYSTEGRPCHRLPQSHGPWRV